MISIIQKILNKCLNFVRGKYSYRYVEEVPDRMSAGTLYIAKDYGINWLAAMKCPCGCNETVYLNLLPEVKPSWKVCVNRKELPSVYPSIWRNIGCKSHYFLRNGSIVWADATTANVTSKNYEEVCPWNH